MNTSNVRWPDSLWAATTPSGPELPELTGTQQADVIVIGGGFTGLSTALHLREAGVEIGARGSIMFCRGEDAEQFHIVGVEHDGVIARSHMRAVGAARRHGETEPLVVLG